MKIEVPPGKLGNEYVVRCWRKRCPNHSVLTTIFASHPEEAIELLEEHHGWRRVWVPGEPHNRWYCKQCWELPFDE